jgi:hypothetical protein
LKLKFLACLICLLVIVAAVDSVPDPPAMNPRNRDSFAISALHVHAPSAPSGKQPFAVGWLLRQFTVRLFSFRLGFDSEPAGSGLPVLLRHATDP